LNILNHNNKNTYGFIIEIKSEFELVGFNKKKERVNLMISVKF